MSYLKNLNKLKFTGMVKRREEEIKKASDIMVPDNFAYKANRIATALHLSLIHI